MSETNGTAGIDDSLLKDVLFNISSLRTDFLRRLSDPRRDIDDECGFPKTISAEDYLQVYEREAIAARVVEVIPAECWRALPEVYEDEDEDVETEFEAAWRELCKSYYGEVNYYDDKEGGFLYSTLYDLDVQRGIGQYGVLLYGFDDGQPLSTPVGGVEETNSGVDVSKGVYNLAIAPEKRKLTFLRVFNQVNASITKYETNVSSPRFGMPIMYHLTLDETRSTGEGAGVPFSGFDVHWTRVLHAMSDGGSACSKTFGVPRLQQVYNDVQGERKLAGGSPEGFWKMCFTSLILETLPQLGASPKVNREALKDRIEEYQNSLQKVLFLSGMTAKSIAPSVTDPTPHHNMLIERICIKLGIPVPVFKGYEIGEQASDNNERSWNRRVESLRNRERSPRILVPFINRLIAFGALPTPEKFCAHWPDIAEMTKQEEATLASTRQGAIAVYVDKGSSVMTPLDFWTREMGYTQEEAQEIIDANEEAQQEEDEAQDLLDTEEPEDEEYEDEELPFAEDEEE